jgi:proline iminopeptidase
MWSGLFHSGPLFREPKHVILEGMHPVPGGHQVHYEVVGNNTGKPVVFLHGGPGRGIDHSVWSFFNPRKYRIILVDQRGSGRSTPRGSLDYNTTGDIVEDLESIRILLGVEKWMLFGCGSGSFLARAYAQKYPTNVSEIVLTGLVSFSPKEIDWLFRYGASEHFPEAWADFAKPIVMAPKNGWEKFLVRLRGNKPMTPGQWFLRPAGDVSLLKIYHHLLTEGNEDEQHEAVRAWTNWENTVCGDAKRSAEGPAYEQASVVARIASYYFLNGGFIKPEDMLKGLNVIRAHRIPGIIVHGENDTVSPIAHAMELVRAWPEAKFVRVPGAGHSIVDQNIQRALVQVTEDLGGCGCLFKFGQEESAQH